MCILIELFFENNYMPPQKIWINVVYVNVTKIRDTTKVCESRLFCEAFVDPTGLMA